MRDVYVAKGPVDISHSAGDDFSHPFQLRLEVTDGKRGVAGEIDASVAIDLSGITARLPGYFRKTADPNVKEDRKEDFEIPQTFLTNWHYRIHLPTGYQLKGLPDSQDRDLGIAHFSAHYRTSQDLLEADYSFALDHRTLTASQGADLRNAITEFQKQPIILLSFLPKGRAYLQAGKVADGLSAFAASCKANPKAAIPHVQYAMALIEEGMGETARAEARVATTIDPKLASAWRTLGFVLLNDLIGRQFSPGFDPSGAEEALRKAIALDAEDLVAKRNLAVLFEYDSNGTRYASRSRLAEAIKVYRGMGDDLASQGLTENLLYDLAYAADFKDLKTETDKLAASQIVTGLRLVAIGQLDGTAAAIAESKTALSDEATRSLALQNAAQILLNMRNYPLAGDFLEAASVGSKNANQLSGRAQMVRKIKVADISHWQPDTARTYRHIV